MYAEVIPSVRLPQTISFFDYGVPQDLIKKIKVGHLVSVPFRNAVRNGIVIRLKKFSAVPPERLKQILAISEPKPIVPPEVAELIFWTAERYLISPAAVFYGILPKFLKRKSNRGGKKEKSVSVAGGSRPRLTAEIRAWAKTLWRDLRATKPTLIRYRDTAHKNLLLVALALRAAAERSSIIILLPRVADVEYLKALILAASKKTPLAVLHHQMNKTEFSAAWLGLASGRLTVALGTRSAIFAPLAKPRLIVIDDEEAQDYKQAEQNPRFDARSVARRRAALAKSGLLLISQAPRLETMAAGKEGRINLLSVDREFEPRECRLVFLGSHALAKSELIGTTLFEAIGESLQNGQKALLFINRRGGARLIRCRDCRHLWSCPRCEVALTAHGDVLRCHHCGFAEALPPFCPSCSGINISLWGAGAERLEEEVRRLFPEAKVKRVDSDTATNKKETLAADIIVGTQLLLNHLKDFSEKISAGVVALALADTAFAQPEFTAAERAFEWITQLRNLAAGFGARFLTQTFLEDAPPITAAMGADDAFYDREIEERRELGYPPFKTLVKITASNARELKELLNKIEPQLKKIDGEAIGPTLGFPPVIRGRSRHNLILKIPPKHDALIPELLAGAPRNLIIDVEPQNLS